MRMIDPELYSDHVDNKASHCARMIAGLLEIAKTELRHCKGLFSSANESVLKELGIS